jgi:hypothetical protein
MTGKGGRHVVSDEPSSESAPGEPEDPVEELAQVERELAELEREADELREEIGARSESPGDQADQTALITSLEWQEALIETLRARRAALLAHLAPG